MTTLTIGPIGALHRASFRSAAFQLGVTINESKGLLTSMFDLRGSERSLEILRQSVVDLSESQRHDEHVAFVERMERHERRRLRWGRLLGRTRRFEDLSRAESNEIHLLMREATWHGTIGDRGADRRLSQGMDTLGRLLDDESATDYVVNVVAAVNMRHLQQDVRLGNVRVARELRRRILAVRVPMDTWED